MTYYYIYNFVISHGGCYSYNPKTKGFVTEVGALCNKLGLELHKGTKFLAGYFHSPSKPHAFSNLPLQSQAGMYISLVASSSGVVIMALDISDLTDILNNLIPNITLPSYTFTRIDVPTFPDCPIPHIYSPLSDNPKSLTYYG